MPAPVFLVLVLCLVSFLGGGGDGGEAYHVETVEANLKGYSGAEAVVDARDYENVLLLEKLPEPCCGRNCCMFRGSVGSHIESIVGSQDMGCVRVGIS